MSKIYKPIKNKMKIPLYSEAVKAGFPSPADDFVEGRLDLNEYLIKHPVATFFVRVTGDSMMGAGIHSGDILIVDRSLEVVNRSIVVAVIDGDLTVKRYLDKGNLIVLSPENTGYPEIKITPEMDFKIWGVVTTVIHKV